MTDMNPLQTLIQQLSVVIINLVFFLAVIQPRRFSRITSGLLTSAVFILTGLPHFLLPSFFSAGKAAEPEGLVFHFIFWILCMALQYGLFFVLLKREWLRNMMLYVLWDISIALFLSLEAAAINLFLPQVQLQGFTALFCTAVSAILAASVLRLPRLQSMNLPGAFCVVIIIIYSVGRLANTLSLFRFSENDWKKLVLYPVLLLAVFLLLGIFSASLGLNLYITCRSRSMEKIYSGQNSRENSSIHKLLYNLGQNCRQRHMAFDSWVSINTCSSEAKGGLLYMIQILFDLSQKGSGRQPDEILISVQECKGFLLLSSRSAYPRGFEGAGKRILSILRNTFLEILFNRMVKNSRGRIQYLDASPLGQHIRVILPLP